MPGEKYVATDTEVYWIPDGSTTEVNIGIYGRNAEWGNDVDQIDASSYGDGETDNIAGRLTRTFSMEMLLDDDYEIEDVLFPKAKGTILHYPHGRVAGKRERTAVCEVLSAPLQEPDNDVAMMPAEFSVRAGTYAATAYSP